MINDGRFSTTFPSVCVLGNCIIGNSHALIISSNILDIYIKKMNLTFNESSIITLMITPYTAGRSTGGFNWVGLDKSKIEIL